MTEASAFQRSLQRMGVDEAVLEEYLELYLHASTLDASYTRTGIDIYRNPEYQAVQQYLQPQPGERILDVGSGDTPWATYLFSRFGSTVYATDPDSAPLSMQREFLRRLKRLSSLGTRFLVLQQDPRRLSFPRDFFDKATAIGVIERFPEEEDIQIVRELARVVRLGGWVILTAPFSPVYMDYPADPASGGSRRYDVQEFHRRFGALPGLTLQSVCYIEARTEMIDRFLENWYSNRLYQDLGSASALISLNLFQGVEASSPLCRGLVAAFQVTESDS